MWKLDSPIKLGEKTYTHLIRQELTVRETERMVAYRFMLAYENPGGTMQQAEVLIDREGIKTQLPGPPLQDAMLMLELGAESSPFYAGVLTRLQDLCGWIEQHLTRVADEDRGLNHSQMDIGGQGFSLAGHWEADKPFVMQIEDIRPTEEELLVERPKQRTDGLWVHKDGLLTNDKGQEVDEEGTLIAPPQRPPSQRQHEKQNPEQVVKVGKPGKSRLETGASRMKGAA